MHMQHESAKRGSQIVGKRVILHTFEDEVNRQIVRQFVDGQILSIQAHIRKQVQLMPVNVKDDFSYRVFTIVMQNWFDFCEEKKIFWKTPVHFVRFGLNKWQIF